MTEDSRETLTPDEIASALKIAGELIAAGVPVFAAAPNSAKPGAYHLPKEWEQTAPNLSVLDRWRPGWALGAVGGHVADFLDTDPRSGGLESAREVRLAGQWPRSFGEQETPSGGRHDVISATGERKATGFMPGLDLQAGARRPDAHGGHGRGFIYISPTVRPSKAPETLGQLRPYRWITRPDLDLLAEFAGSDDSLEGVLARIQSWQSAKSTKGTKARSETVRSPYEGSEDPLFYGTANGYRADRSFTADAVGVYVAPALARLRGAPIGEIEERANAAAVTLAHFVPEFWTPAEAFGELMTALDQTAYDPNGPSDWRAEKFIPVLDGTRPPADSWKATRRAEASGDRLFGGVAPAVAALFDPTAEPERVPTPETAEQATSLVDALLAEMLTAGEVASRPAPKPLIRGLLNLDSEAWVIGPPGSKKSFVAFDWAAHVALGKPWQEHRVTQGHVVMIVAEGAGGMAPRVRAWEKIHGPIGQGMSILPRPVQAADGVAWLTLVEACRRLRPALVILDTQARVTVGLEENSAKEMGLYIEAVRRIREATGACVLTVHHTGRQGGDARGSSAIDGAQGTELKVVANGLSGTLSVEKQKDMEQGPDMPLTFEVVDVGVDEEGETITSLVLASHDPLLQASGLDQPEPWETGHAKVQDQILKVLRDQGGAAGLTQDEARRYVADRWHGGRIAKSGDGLRPSTWGSAWSRIDTRTNVEGELIVVVNGARKALDPVAFRTMPVAGQNGS